MKRRLFNIVAAASLCGCLASAALWARSLGHFELVHFKYAHWPQPDELHSIVGSFTWYSNTLRLEVIYVPYPPSYFRSTWNDSFRSAWDDIIAGLRADCPPGLRYNFVDEGTTSLMNGYPPGFAGGHYSYTPYRAAGDRWVLAVRPWLPTLLTAMLPAIWVYRYRRAANSSAYWQFGLRGMFVLMTVLCIFLWLFIRLKN